MANLFMDTMTGIGNAMGSVVSGVGNMFSWGGGAPSNPGMPAGTMPQPTPKYANYGGPMTQGAQAAVPTYQGGTMNMPQLYDPAALGAANAASASPVTSAGIDPTTGKATSDIKNAEGDIARFKENLARTNALGFAPEGLTAVGDYALNQDQLTQYHQLTEAYGALPGERMGVKAEGAPSWFAAKGVPIAKMALAGGSLYLGSKSADLFKQQMDAAQQMAQENMQNQEALIKASAYEKQLSRWMSDPERYKHPDEYRQEQPTA